MGVTSIGIKPERRWSRVLAAVLIVGFAYVFSVGPVLTLADKYRLGGTTLFRPLRAFYAPVFFVARSSNTGTHIYESYLGFWCRIILHQEYQKITPAPPMEALISSIGGITNGQMSFQIFIPSVMSEHGNPTDENRPIAAVIDKMRGYGLYPAGFQQQTNGRLYAFEPEREWERGK